MPISTLYCVRVRGELACFTRPEFKTERFSYEVITPSAARGILEAILYDLLTRDGARAAAAMASKEAPRKRGGLVRDITNDTAED